MPPVQGARAARPGGPADASSQPTEWPQRRLFIGCVLVGTMNLLALDLVFAPALFTKSPSEAPVAIAVPQPTSTAVAPEQRAAPARTRVPTIVARFARTAKEADEDATIRLLATAMIEAHAAAIRLEGRGDTDVDGPSLGLERARWVKARLVDRGVSAERIETAAAGPGASADDEGARVEAHWIEPSRAMPDEGEARK